MSLEKLAIAFEKLVDHKLAEALNAATKITIAVVNELQKLAVDADKAVPIIEAVETNPLFTAIVADIPGGAAAEAAVIKVINRYLPYIHAAVNDPVILRGLQQHVTAELTSVLHGVQSVIDRYLEKVIKFFDVLGI